jgi:hypothetical protein
MRNKVKVFRPRIRKGDRVIDREEAERIRIDREDLLAARNRLAILEATIRNYGLDAEKIRKENVELRRRAEDAEFLVKRDERDRGERDAALRGANERLQELHSKLRERENAILAVAITLGEKKLLESFATTGR